METIKNVIDLVGSLGTIYSVILIVLSITIWLNGIAPTLWRLGNGLARRKLAVFGSTENTQSLASSLTDSKLFKSKKITHINTIGDIGRAEEASVYLVVWPDFQEGLETVLQKKSDATAMIVYAPKGTGPIPEDTMEKLGQHRNLTVTNFRGRLLNDVVAAMITTSYEKT